MEYANIKPALTKIEILWTTVSKENSDDPRAYTYISDQSMILRATVVNLKNEIGYRIRTDKKDKLLYQKLHKSLISMEDTLDFEQTPCKDKCYIDSILRRLSQLKKHIDIVIQYQ